jgi:hypothetical protein
MMNTRVFRKVHRRANEEKAFEENKEP